MEEGAQLTSCIEMQLLLLIQIFGPISPLGPCPELILFSFFSWVTMVTIGIIFHNHILF